MCRKREQTQSKINQKKAENWPYLEPAPAGPCPSAGILLVRLESRLQTLHDHHRETRLGRTYCVLLEIIYLKIENE